MRIVSLHIYPLKSGASQSVETALVTPRGLEHDRRWMLVTPNGHFLTARNHPKLLLIQASIDARGLQCRVDGRSLSVRWPESEPRLVEIWGQNTAACDAGEEAADWFSGFLELPCRLVYQRNSDHRPVAPLATTTPKDIVSFADGYPMLLIGSASLEDLNRRIDCRLPIPMERFRPNIVVSTDSPFEEDHWTRIQAGDVEFVNAKPCSRCVLVTIDASTGNRDPDGQPLRALARFRTDPNGKKILFGTNIIPRTLGKLRVGDPVVVEHSDHVPPR